MTQDINYVLTKYGGTVYRVALSKTGDPDAAQDIYQQVFLLLYQKKPEFSDTQKLKAWLIRAAIKYSAAHRRRFDNSKTVALESAYDAAVTDSTEFELIDLLSRLDESMRTVTLLFYIEDMSIEGIAKALGLTNAAVKMRLSRARKTLKKIYEEELL